MTASHNTGEGADLESDREGRGRAAPLQPAATRGTARRARPPGAPRGLKARRSGPAVKSGAFTLLELLCVIAVIGLLAALIIPSVGGARRSANKAKVKVQFAQWTAAIEAFRAEYGYYPAFDASNLVNGGVTAADHPFHDVLAGRRRDGTALAAGSPAALQNRKLVRFHTFTDAELNAAGLVRDAFDNTALAVLVDRDLDGFIRAGTDFTNLPAVAGLTPTSVDIPPTGVRSGVIFYAPSPGATPTNPEFIFSWK